MKKNLISLLLINMFVNNLMAENLEPKSSSIKTGLLTVGGLAIVAGGCYHVKSKWSSVAWVSKKYLGQQLQYLNNVLECDLRLIRKNLKGLKDDLSQVATKKDLDTLAGDLKNLQATADKILAAIEKRELKN